MSYFRLIVPFSVVAAGMLANPQNPNVVSGAAEISSNQKLLEISASDGAVIHWSDFSIEPSEVTRFLQPGPNAAVLNKVTGLKLSSLLGTLEANGQVYLVNPNGVIVGKDAVIRTAGLFLSTFDLDEVGFAEEKEWVLKGEGTIVNWGTVEALDGDLYLVAEKIENHGALRAERGAVELAAGKEVIVRPYSHDRISIRPSKELFAGGIDNEGSIEAIKVELLAGMNPFGLAINHKGSAEALGIHERGGRLLLATEGQISVKGELKGKNIDVWGDSVEILPLSEIDASGPLGGGEISIGHAKTRYVRADQRSFIKADALENGDGGKIVLWGEHVAASQAALSARGGPLDGNGGFIELSGKGLVMPGGEADTRAPAGKAGMFLIDPADVTIDGANTNLGPFLLPPPPPIPGTHYSFTGNASILNTSMMDPNNLATHLATTNVLIDTADGVGGVGDIFVNAPVLWSSQYSLYLTANHDIQLNQNVQCSGAGGLILFATNDITVNSATSMIPVDVAMASGPLTIQHCANLILSGGMAAGAHAAMTSGSGNISFVSTGNVELLGGTAAACYAQISSTSGTITGSAGTDIALQGGDGANSSAAILGGSKAVSLTAGNDLTASGGSGTLAFAEISSITGNVTIPNVGRDLRLTGGVGTQAYAQIGKGFTSGALAIQSDINIQAVGRDVILQGNTTLGSGSYAQIGHSPFPGASPLTASGSITLSNQVGIGNNLTLNGGGAPQTSAVIGHGNSFSTLLGTCSGDIHLFAENDISLTGGTVSEAHAVIGFSNPDVGSVAVFHATSSVVHVETTASGNLFLNGGTGTNAVIGYYNETSVTGLPVIDFTSIEATTVGISIIQLTAGSLVAGTNGVAAIGSLVNMGSANSNITLNSSQLEVLGPQGAGINGSARVINQKPPCVAPCVPGCTPTTRFIKMNLTSGMGRLDVQGGIGATVGFADIYSSGTLTIDFLTDMTVNDNMTLQNGYAHVTACGDILLNTIFEGRNLFVSGGSNAVADAVIQSYSGNVNWGKNLFGGMFDLRVGSATSQARSLIVAEGNIHLGNSGNVFVLGGTMGGTPAPYAQITSDNGNVTLNSGGSLTITGGTVADSFAQIASTNGDVTLNFSGSATLTGGTGAATTNAYAQVGRGIGESVTTPIINVNSNIYLQQFASVFGSPAILLEGGSGPGCYAQIGQSPFNPMASTTATGNVCTNFLLLQGEVRLVGGTNDRTTAIIGHGNELTPTLQSINGSISIATLTGGITLLPGLPQTSHTTIGFHSPTGGSTVALTGTTTTALGSCSPPALFRGVTVTSNNGDISLTGGLGTGGSPGSNAVIGYYNNTNTIGPNITIDNILVTTNGTDDITLQAHFGGITGGIAAIGTLTNTGTAVSNINVSSGHNVNLFGPTGPMEDSAARIVNSFPGVTNPLFNVQISAANNLTLLGGTGGVPPDTGFADVYSCNNATVSFMGTCTINTTLQMGYAQMVAAQNMEVNTAPIGVALNMAGGINPGPPAPGAYALIEAVNGHCFVGGSFPGPQTITIGDPASLAPSSIVAIQDTNAVAASQSITLNGGAGPDVYAYIQNTNGLITVNAGTTLTLNGGSGTSATAEIQNANQGITGQVGTTMTLNGGSGMSAFAQIGTFTGQILFTNVGGSVLLNGGTAPQAYAQVGRGLETASSNINSSILFNNIGGDVIFTGGTAPSTYTQIGQSPFGGGPMMTYAAQGDISMTVFGFIQLNGGAFPDTSATIGHGNPLTDQLTSAIGMISLTAIDIPGVALNPGSGLDAHATIGFFSPFAGSPNGFGVNSNGISVTTVNGPIDIIAANGNNATIGYYNAATPTSVAVTIASIQLNAPTTPPSPPDQILLQADNGGPTNGIASVGTFAASMGSSTVTNSLSINVYELDVLGPIPGNNGQALIYNNQPGVISSDSMTLMTTNLNVIGGLGNSPGMAAIYSDGTMEIDFSGVFNINLDPNSPATLQLLDATVTAGGDITVNPNNNAGDMNLLGTEVPGGLSQMNSIAGNIFFGDPTQAFTGVGQLMIGRPDMIGTARIFTSPGTGVDINLFADGPLLIQGGSMPGAIADLNANGGLTSLVNHDISLLGGFGMGANALMNASTDKFYVISLGAINLTGGPMSFATFSEQAPSSLLHVEALHDINVNLNSTIENAGNGASFLSAENDIRLTQNGSIINFGTGPLDALAGVSLFLLDDSLVQTSGGQLSLVVDNLYPTPPGIGSGSFQLASGAIVSSGGGPLRVFTARRPQNNIQGLLNAFPFVPGIEFINTATEIWNVYYFSALGGNPFTIFYKDFISVPSVIQSQRFGVNEFFQEIKAYDDLHFRAIPTLLGYNREAYQSIPRALQSYQAVPDIRYGMIRRTYRTYNLKKLDLLQ